MSELFDHNKYLHFAEIEGELRTILENDFGGGSTKQSSSPLVDIIVHKSYAEMFLILQGQESLEDGSINQFVKEWEDKVMNFINFSDVPEITEKLRYDIHLLILYESGSEETNTKESAEKKYAKDIFKIEKSLRNCRKIFIPSKNGEILDEGKVFLTNTVLNLIDSDTEESKGESNYKNKIDNILKKFDASKVETLERKGADLEVIEKRILRKWVDENHDN